MGGKGRRKGQLHFFYSVLLQLKEDKKHLRLQPRGDWHELRSTFYPDKEQNMPNTQASWHTFTTQKV